MAWFTPAFATAAGLDTGRPEGKGPGPNPSLGSVLLAAAGLQILVVAACR